MNHPIKPIKPTRKRKEVDHILIYTHDGRVGDGDVELNLEHLLERCPSGTDLKDIMVNVSWESAEERGSDCCVEYYHIQRTNKKDNKKQYEKAIIKYKKDLVKYKANMKKYYAWEIRLNEKYLSQLKKAYDKTHKTKS